MVGAIVGDIIGSRFEFHNCRSKDFELFTDECFFTDDTVMSLAVCKALMDEGDLSNNAIKRMRELGTLYPDAGYGNMFQEWLYNPKPYNSFGNGAAMRVSACGWVGGNVREVVRLSKEVTRVSHSHKEGIKGAEAVALAVYMARNRFPIDTMKRLLAHYYRLDFTLGPIPFDETCQGTVPFALKAFLESKDFEDAIRNAISIGGDSDTLGAITGAVAGAYYGVPKWIRGRALGYLDDRLRGILEEFEEYIH